MKDFSTLQIPCVRSLKKAYEYYIKKDYEEALMQCSYAKVDLIDAMEVLEKLIMEKEK